MKPSKRFQKELLAFKEHIKLKYNIKRIMFKALVGKFQIGFLHCVAYRRNVLTVLNVEDMVLFEIRLHTHINQSAHTIFDM